MSIKKTREAKKLIETMAPQGEFLAFINDREAKMLKDAGGSGIMTAAGIPSFVDFTDTSQGISAADTLGASAFEGTGGTGEGDSNIGQSPDTRGGINVAPTPKTLGQRIKDFFTGVTRFSPTKAVTSGLGFILDKLQDLRGFNPDGTRRTQAQYEQARNQRIARNRIENILSRDAPFTELTQDRLNQLAAVLGIAAPQVIPGTTDVVGGPRQDDTPIASSDSLINRDPRLDGSFTVNIPQSGIVTQAPQTFREAMAALNLDRGITSRNIVPNNLMTEQLSFPFDTFNTGDPFKDNLYSPDGTYKPTQNVLLADASQDINKEFLDKVINPQLMEQNIDPYLRQIDEKQKRLDELMGIIG